MPLNWIHLIISISSLGDAAVISTGDLVEPLLIISSQEPLFIASALHIDVTATRPRCSVRIASLYCTEHVSSVSCASSTLKQLAFIYLRVFQLCSHSEFKYYTQPFVFRLQITISAHP